MYNYVKCYKYIVILSSAIIIKQRSQKTIYITCVLEQTLLKKNIKLVNLKTISAVKKK